MERAERLQAIQKQVMDSGFDPVKNPEAFMAFMASKLVQGGFVEEGMKIAQQLQARKNKLAEIEIKTSTAISKARTATVAESKETRGILAAAGERRKTTLEGDKLLTEIKLNQAKLKTASGVNFDRASIKGFPQIVQKMIIVNAEKDHPGSTGLTAKNIKLLERDIVLDSTRRLVLGDVITPIFLKMLKVGREEESAPGAGDGLTKGEIAALESASKIPGFFETLMRNSIPAGGPAGSPKRRSELNR